VLTVEKERPRILGALLDAVAQGLRMLPQTELDELPRMADFAVWATACESGLWPAGTFWEAYCGNRDEGDRRRSCRRHRAHLYGESRRVEGDRYRPSGRAW
jgi:hypothetical protein